MEKKNRSVFFSSVPTWNLPLSNTANLEANPTTIACACLWGRTAVKTVSIVLSISQQILPVSDPSSPFCLLEEWDREVPRVTLCHSCPRRDIPFLPPAETAAENQQMPKMGFLWWALPQMHLLTISKDLQNKTLCRQQVGVGLGWAFITLTARECHGGDELTTHSRRLLLGYPEPGSDTPRAVNTTQPTSSAPFSKGETRNAGTFVCWVARAAVPVSADPSCFYFALRQ